MHLSPLFTSPSERPRRRNIATAPVCSTRMSNDPYRRYERRHRPASTGTAPPPPPIDWNGDLNLTNDHGLSQDISFNGGKTTSLRGSDDWSFIGTVGLRQVGSRPNANGSSLDVTAEDVGREDPGREDPGREDPGREDPGREDPGREDPGREDPGKELDFDEATSVGHPPHSLKAVAGNKIVTLTWRPPTLPHGDGPTSYVMYRVVGTTFDATNFQKREQMNWTDNYTTQWVAPDDRFKGKAGHHLYLWCHIDRGGHSKRPVEFRDGASTAGMSRDDSRY